MSSTTTYEHDADGSKFIPATQRPDGTWRKPRRIKDGYVPQEEVPLYESKGKLFRARQNDGLPVGLTPEIVAQAQKKKGQKSTIQPIPGMIISVEKKKKKKKPVAAVAVEETTEKLAKCALRETQPSQSAPSENAQSDPSKRLKNLRKKLREIEFLEEKVKAGLLKIPDKDQKEKMSKKTEILTEIDILEKIST